MEQLKKVIEKQKELINKFRLLIDWDDVTDSCLNNRNRLESELSALESQEVITTDEKNVTIPKWQMVKIEDTLRMAYNIHHSGSKETCFDRCLCKTWDWTKKSLEIPSKENQTNNE